MTNEVRAYRLLEGVPGVPRLLGRPCSYSFLLEYIEGDSVRWLEQLPWEAIDQARQLVRALHSRGVVHGDLGHDWHGDLGRDTNLIWGRNGQLYIIDFASALYRGPWTLGLYDVFRRHDELLVTKLLRRFFPEAREEREYDLRSQLSPLASRLLLSLKKL